LRRVMKSTEIKARFPLCFGRHTHDRMKIWALRNIHPGSCHCKNTFFWYATCVVWETFTDVLNDHTASPSKAEDGGSGFLQTPLHFDLNIVSHCRRWYTSTASTTTHQGSPIFDKNFRKSNQKRLQTSWYYIKNCPKASKAVFTQN
jgi:hypothetical protein